MQLKLEGRQNKTCYVEGNSVKIIKEAGIFASERIKTIPIRNITSVEVKKPGAMFNGFIQFSIAGGKARDSSLTISGGTIDAAKDENSVIFAGSELYQLALKIKDYVENYTEGKALPNISEADEIRKFKALLDEGLITTEDFEKKKKDILGL